MSDATVGQTKQFGKGQRTVPHPALQAQKWYPVDDESKPKKVRIPHINRSNRKEQRGGYEQGIGCWDECDKGARDVRIVSTRQTDTFVDETG